MKFFLRETRGPIFQESCHGTAPWAALQVARDQIAANELVQLKPKTPFAPETQSSLP